MKENKNFQISSVSATRQFWIAALCFAALWTVVPTLVFPNFRPDIIEQFFVGREWTFGSGSHPALTANLLDLTSRIAGIAVAPSLTAALFNLLALWSIHRLAREYLAPGPALAAAFSMFGYWHIFQMEGTNYNNSVTLDAFWIFAAYLAFKAIETEKKGWWFAAGAGIGLGLYFKYTMAVLPLVIVLFLIADRDKRRLWLTPGPWISTGTAFALFAPYAIWLLKTGFFSSITYALGRAPRQLRWWGHLWVPIELLIHQIPLILPPLFCLIPILRHRKTDSVAGEMNLPEAVDNTGWKRRYLGWLLLGPFLFNLTWSALGGVHLRGALGCHIWMPLSIWALVFLSRDVSPRAVKRSCVLSLGFDLVCLIGTAVLVPLAPLFENHVPRYYYPGKEIAALAESIWHEEYPDPLPWVMGVPWNHGPMYDTWPWEAGNVSVYGRDRARVYAGPKYSSWGSFEQVRGEGGLFLWTPSKRDEEFLGVLRRDFPAVRIVGTYSVKPKSRYLEEEIPIGIALIPPSTEDRTGQSQ
ncbi:MAG: glycosyltransferase family 39 protein [Thermoguttaceae bacterium]|nr:glycosyltransferase family 39 protein [Thermoguttaceae bacterium]